MSRHYHSAKPVTCHYIGEFILIAIVALLLFLIYKVVLSIIGVCAIAIWTIGEVIQGNGIHVLHVIYKNVVTFLWSQLLAAFWGHIVGDVVVLGASLIYWIIYKNNDFFPKITRFNLTLFIIPYALYAIYILFCNI